MGSGDALEKPVDYLNPPADAGGTDRSALLFALCFLVSRIRRV